MLQEEALVGEARCLGSIHSSTAAFPKDPGHAAQGLPGKCFGSPISHPLATANPPHQTLQHNTVLAPRVHPTSGSKDPPLSTSPPRRDVNPRKSPRALASSHLHSWHFKTQQGRYHPAASERSPLPLMSVGFKQVEFWQDQGLFISQRRGLALLAH